MFEVYTDSMDIQTTVSSWETKDEAIKAGTELYGKYLEPNRSEVEVFWSDNGYTPKIVTVMWREVK